MLKTSLFAALAFSAALPSFAADYVQAKGSSLGFAGSYQSVAFKGNFPSFSTRLSFDPSRLADAKLDVTIPLGDATTRNAEYDSQMRSTSFFNIKSFPQAHYQATKFRSLGGNRYAADGTLTLRGVNKPVTLTFTWTPGAKPKLVGQAVVKRMEFGVGSGDLVDAGIIPNDIPNEIKVVTTVIFQVGK